MLKKIQNRHNNMLGPLSFSRKKNKTKSSAESESASTDKSPRLSTERRTSTDRRVSTEKSPRNLSLSSKGGLSLSSKNNQPAEPIKFEKVETKKEDTDFIYGDESGEPHSSDSSDEFLSEHSEESKKKIRAARRRYKKQGCGDGGWDQARIDVPTVKKWLDF